MNSISDVFSQSPWLEDPDWEVKDRNLRRIQESSIRFRHLSPQFLIHLKGINIIRGPRQVGKTSELKLLIRDALHSGCAPESVVYFSCDNVLNRKELSEIIVSLCSFWNTKKIKKGYLFLDEITSVKEWSKAVKASVDTGFLEGHSIIATGSSAFEIRRGFERMPGRREGGYDLAFLPMDFPDFIKCRHDSQVVYPSIFDVISSQKKFDQFQSSIIQKEKFFRSELDTFARSGGLPFMVSLLNKHSTLDDETSRTLASLVYSEVEKNRFSRPLAQSLLYKINEALLSPVSLNSLASDSEIHSPTTVNKYMELLISSFIIFQVKALDLNKKRPFPKKNFKTYFLDPAFRKILTRTDLEIPLGPKEAETMVGVHLARMFNKDFVNQEGDLHLFYWKSKSGKEVDFVVYHDSHPVGFEVKYQNRISGHDEMSIAQGIGKGCIITKDSFSWGAVPRIPLWAFLLTNPKIGNDS